jgi:hypothetical protein
LPQQLEHVGTRVDIEREGNLGEGLAQHLLGRFSVKYQVAGFWPVHKNVI